MWGKFSGKRKLIALVSPGKTVEGTIGLILGGTVAACLFGLFLFPDISVYHFLFLGFAGGIIGQLGDLCESVIKRSYGKKMPVRFFRGMAG